MDNNSLFERLEIVENMITEILNCTKSDAHNIIIASQMHKNLEQNDYSTLYDSPQANLSSLGQELRESNNPLGYNITDDNIRAAMVKMRNNNEIKR